MEGMEEKTACGIRPPSSLEPLHGAADVICAYRCRCHFINAADFELCLQLGKAVDAFVGLG